MADYDSPWKDAVDGFFLWFLSFFFPKIYADLDLTQDHEFLEQEMRKLLPAARTGKRLADKLVKLTTKEGDVRYLHVEVQGDAEDAFEHRMDVYNYRARDRVGQPVVSVAVLADDDPTWRPSAYVFSCWGFEQSLRFPPIKVLDYARRAAELEADPNPFALFVLAHLQSRQTRGDPQARADVKLRLILKLYERNLDAENLRQWYRLLDYLLELPPWRP
jgi:hypothetical protein